MKDITEFLSNNCVNSLVFAPEKFRAKISENFPFIKILGKPEKHCLVIFDDKAAKKYESPAYLSENSEEITGMNNWDPKELKIKKGKISQYNPPVIIEKHNNFFVFRDDKLPGGTKQRLIECYAESIKSKKYIVYAGPSSGAAQVFLGLMANFTGLKAIMFTDILKTRLKSRAADLGVEHREFAANLAHIQELAVDFCKKNNATCVPFGLDCPAAEKCLIKALRASVPEDLRKKVKRLWCVVGSAFLLHVLYEIFPNAFICGVQVGKKIYRDMIRPERTRIFISKIKFNKPANIMPPYPSVENYDAKIWEFVLKFGKKNDYVWNVAG